MILTFRRRSLIIPIYLNLLMRKIKIYLSNTRKVYLTSNQEICEKKPVACHCEYLIVKNSGYPSSKFNENILLTMKIYI
jgi:hypothetical protein